MRGRAVFRLIGVIFAALASLVVGAALLWGWLDRELMARAPLLDLFVVLGLIFLPVGAIAVHEIDRRLRPASAPAAAQRQRSVAAETSLRPVELWRALILQDDEESGDSEAGPGARRHPGRVAVASVSASRARRAAARRIAAPTD